MPSERRPTPIPTPRRARRTGARRQPAAHAAALLLALLPVAMSRAQSAVNPTPAAADAAQAAAAQDDAATSLDAVVVRGQAHRAGPLALDVSHPTGSRLGLTARELPASVSVVTRETIRDSGARTALEAIENAVGMTGLIGVGSIPSYSTRGFAGNDVTILRDGIRQNTASQASRPLDSFLFDRIEVLKGPASLLYGEGAVGGAVNYVSKRASDVFTGEALLSAGSWSNAAVAVGLGGPTALDGLSFRADASRRQERGYVERSDARYDAFAGELRWTLSPDTSLRLAGTVLDDDVESYYGTPLVYDAVIDANAVRQVRRANPATDRLVNARIEPATRRLNYNHAGNFARARNTFWRAIGETRLSPAWTLRNETYAATQRLDWQNTESTVWNPATGRVDRSAFFLIYRDDLQLGNRLDLAWSGRLFGRPNRFLVGALYERNDQDRNSGQPVPPSPIPASVPLTGFDPGVAPDVAPVVTANIVTRTAAVYAEDTLELTPRLTLVGGLRLERIELERRSFTGAAPFGKRYRPVTGRLGAVYALRPELNVYASASSAAQPVAQLVSLTAAQDEFSLQTGRQYEIGAKASAPGGRADATLALFEIRKQDLLTSTLVDGVRINSQIGAQVSQGLELDLALQPAPGWRVGAQLAWLWKAEFESFNENLGSGVVSRSGNTPPNVPRRVAGASVVREWGPWHARAAVRHVGEREANTSNGIQLPAYTTLDASLGRQFDRVRVSLRGRNLTDRQYAPAAAAGGLVWRLADPRSIELGVEYAF